MQTLKSLPKDRVNIPDPRNPDSRIVGFRIREGDEAWGETGLSEPLFWLDKVLNTRPAAPVEGLEVVAWKHPTSDWASNDYYQVECHCLKVGPMPIPLVTRSQAEAIIAALQSDVTGSASVIEHLKQRANNAEANAEKYREYAAEKSNQVAALQQTLAAETADNAALMARVDEYVAGLVHMHQEMIALETQLAAAWKALTEIYGNGDATGCNPQIKVDIALAALETKP